MDRCISYIRRWNVSKIGESVIATLSFSCSFPVTSERCCYWLKINTAMGWKFYQKSVFCATLNNNSLHIEYSNKYKRKYKMKDIYISHDKTWTWLRKGNFKRETESLLMAAQNSAIRTNHIKARVDKKQQNSKCKLCGDRDETINHIISECSKLAQKKYKARHDWVGKVIHWEMCKKFKFDHANKWYMHNQAPVLENDSHKLQWDFDIQTDDLISARRPDLIIINNNNNKKKKICKIFDFTVPADHRIKLKECEKRDKYIDLARELKKTMEYEGENYTNCDWCFWHGI